jgi:hypothetical protein
MEGLSLRPASVYFLPFVVTVLVIVGGAIDPGDFREVTTQQSKLIIQKS